VDDFRLLAIGGKGGVMAQLIVIRWLSYPWIEAPFEFATLSSLPVPAK
jgi:hypothetical protein